MTIENTDILIPDIGERVLLHERASWQEGTVRSVVTSCNKTWVRVENGNGYLFGFQIEEGQSYWREIEFADWVGGIAHGAKFRSPRISFEMLRTTPENLAKRQRDLDTVLVYSIVRKGVESWEPDILRRVAEILREII